MKWLERFTLRALLKSGYQEIKKFIEYHEEIIEKINSLQERP